MNSTSTRMLSALGVALLAASVAPAVSAAARSRQDGDWQIGHLVGGRSTAAAGATWGGHCSGEFVGPGYSASNKTLHWGGEQSCTAPIEQSLRMTLYRVVGTGDFQHYEAVETRTAHAVGWQVFIQRFHPCAGSVSSRWTENAYGIADGHLSVPYPAWSTIVTDPCN